MPGALNAAASKSDGSLIAHLQPWPNDPLTKGSYTCYRPGQFTTVAGLKAQPAGNLHSLESTATATELVLLAVWCDPPLPVRLRDVMLKNQPELLHRILTTLLKL